MPATTCEAIDQKVRNLVWGSTDEVRRTHLISWDRICTHEESGGLGLKLSRLLNRSYMTKLAFTFLKEPDKLWVQVLQRLTKEWHTMLHGATSAIRNDKGTPMWSGRWVDLAVQLLASFNDGAEVPDPIEKVPYYVTDERQWDVDRLSTILQPDAVAIF
ncbi:Putative ribonuclease H protein At1g65750 [Linum perenne]